MLDKQEQYPFSPGTIEGEAIEKLTSEQQVSILQNTEVWNEANKINDEVNLVLAENKKIKVINVDPINGDSPYVLHVRCIKN